MIGAILINKTFNVFYKNSKNQLKIRLFWLLKYELKNVFRFINFILEIKNKELRSKFYGEVIKMPLVKDYDLELTDFEEVALEIRDEKVKKDNSKEIARNFKILGIEISKIANATGLSIEEIESL